MKKTDVIFENIGKVKLVRFPIFDQFNDQLTAVYSTRYGGVSSGIYESMNLSFEQGDSYENVLRNYQLFAAALGTDISQLVLTDQKHTANIRVVTAEDSGNGIIKARDYQAIDGLITNIPGIALVTLHADCAPVYFYDPAQRVIGLAHAGWKGTVAEIAGKMIDQMVEVFRCDPTELIVAVGPAICGECYETGPEVKGEFEQMSIDVSELIRYDRQTDKYFPDIALINAKIVRAKGVREANIMVADSCTMEDTVTFFSHRGHHGKRGSQAAIMQLK